MPSGSGGSTIDSSDTTIYPPSVYSPNENPSQGIVNDSENIENSYPLIREMSEDFDVQLDLIAPHLIRAAEICIDEVEVQTNIIRTLSVLSEQDKTCDVIAEMAPRLGILLGPDPIQSPSKHKIKFSGDKEQVAAIPEKSLGMLSRIGYILGNIMARSDSARLQFYNNDVAMEYLLRSLEAYSTSSFTLKRRASKPGDDEENDGNESDTVVDVVIKLIRVVANMSVNPEVGYGLANSHPLGSVLLSLLLTINKFKFNFVSNALRQQFI